MAFVFLLLVLWGGTHALRTLWGVALLGGLIAAGVVALRYQTLREHAIAVPYATTTPPGGDATITTNPTP